MHNRISTFVALAAVGAAACTPPDAGSPAAAASLATDMQRGSYALGYDFGEQVRPGREAIDLDAYMAGVRDGMADTSAIAWEDRQIAMQGIVEEIRAQMDANQREMANAAIERGNALLAENATREGVMVLESGVQYEILEEGDGPVAEQGDSVLTRYRGSLPDGTVFDSNFDGDPIPFSTAPGALIEGFSEVLTTIPMGSRWRVWIPSELAYGPGGRGPSIGPNQLLIFEIEAIEIIE